MTLYMNLFQQINKHNLQDQVEVLYIQNTGDIPVGHRRNYLISLSKAKYVQFFDDDDTPHKDMVKLIYDELLKNPDVVTFDGEVNFNGRGNKRMEFRLKHKSFELNDCTFTRPPVHLCPIRRAIAKKYVFDLEIKGSDVRWAMAISNDEIIKKEIAIEKILYTYNYDSTK